MPTPGLPSPPPARTPGVLRPRNSPPPRSKVGFGNRDPGRTTGTHGAGGKLVARLHSPIPTQVPPHPRRPGAPRLRSPRPATYLLPQPPWARPASRGVRSSGARAPPERRASSRSCEQPGAGGGRRAPQASERAGGRRSRAAAAAAAEPAPTPSELGPSLSFPTSRPLRLASPALFPPPLLFPPLPLFCLCRPCSLARSFPIF